MRQKLIVGLTVTLVGCGILEDEFLVPFPVQTANRIDHAVPQREVVVKYRRPGRSNHGLPVVRRLEALAMEVVSVPPTNSSALARLKADPNVAYVEPNVIYRLPSRPTQHRSPRLFNIQNLDYSVLSRFEVSDPLRERQYGLERINAPAAWDLNSGHERVVIAVLDTGVDLRHPDLAQKLVPGRAFVNGVNGPQDDNGHGTHCAGIAAALTANGVGIAGVAPRCRIMPVKVLDREGAGDLAGITDAIYWSVHQGADVISMSLGAPEDAQSLREAIQYAIQKGVTVVAAMGNEAELGNPINYPAAYPGVIAIGASDKQDQITSFSSWGRHQSLTAPGSAITSTFPQGDSQMLRDYREDPLMFDPNDFIEPSYADVSGTSQATPFVSGAVALLKSAKPSLTPRAIRQVLMRTARDQGAPGFDEKYGAGILDVAAAIRAVQGGGQ